MSALVTGVAALYVDPRGPYPALVEDWWDETRNAMGYRGAHPIVAHPPCGPWGRLRHLSKRDNIACAPHAVATVQRVGGVLEHPAHSRLWEACGLPRPGAPRDVHGGRTIEVCQCDWGHVARKRTWLYIVGAVVLPPRPPAREPTHWCSGFRSSSKRYPANYRRTGCAVPLGIKVCSAQQRRRTPEAFARWLITIDSEVRS